MGCQERRLEGSRTDYMLCDSDDLGRRIPRFCSHGPILSINVTSVGKWHCWRHNVASSKSEFPIATELGKLKFMLG